MNKPNRYGVLYCAYNTEKYIIPSLTPWVNRKKSHDIIIAGVHGMFKEYHESGYIDHDVETLNLLKAAPLDYLYIQNDYDKPEGQPFYELEHQVRNNGLAYLLANDCDYIILLDSDEIWTEVEIENLLEYIEKNKFITWFSVEYKNLTFTEETYTKGFSPPRVFKVNSTKKLSGLYWDNDFDYNGISYKQLPNKKVPLHLANPKHYTWLNDHRSLDKIRYQTIHFNNGAGCSFRWDDNFGGLGWNLDYFEKTKQPIPKLYNILDKTAN